MLKFAFSTVACPQWPLEKVLEQAAAWGYAGVELRTLGPKGNGLASDPADLDPDHVRDLFANSAVVPVCLSTSASLHHREQSAAFHARKDALDAIKLAAKIGCSQIRVFGNEVMPGRNRQAALQDVASATGHLLETAASHGVGVLFENSGSFNRAKEWWWLLNILDHPLVGMCWNVANAAASGELASVSVPCLNSRIRLAKVKDTRVGEGSGFVPLGEGTVGIEPFVTRLLGIGFTGYVSVEWDRLWLPSLAEAESYLPDALERLQGWVVDEEDGRRKGFGDAEPMNKELRKLLDTAEKNREAATADAS